jgi:hypothetical protein
MSSVITTGHRAIACSKMVLALCTMLLCYAILPVRTNSTKRQILLFLFA